MLREARGFISSTAALRTRISLILHMDFLNSGKNDTARHRGGLLGGPAGPGVALGDLFESFPIQDILG